MNNSTTPNTIHRICEKNNIDRTVLQGARILLVEDNKINQEVALAMLHHRGMLVDVAEDGKQAVKMVGENTYDCILMDLRMPVMDGHTATRIIRNELKLATLPILAMTAKVQDNDVKNALDAGMNCHIPKPINLELLENEMAYWIHHSKGQQLSAKEESKEIQDKKMQGCLEKVGGNNDLFLKVLNAFLERHTSDYEQVVKFMEAGETSKAIKLVHALKGVAPVVGADNLHETAVDLEKLLLAGSYNDSKLLMGSFKIYLENAITFINDYIARHPE